MALISLIMQPTLQEYMADVAEAFNKKVDPAELEEWRTKKFQERVRYFVDKEVIPSSSRWVSDALSLSKCLTAKNDPQAETFRQAGNKKFQQKWYQQAMDEYTECIRYSSAETVSLGYSNRSAALFHLGLFEHCIVDINRAVESNLPAKLRYKVYNRRAVSYRELECYGKAKKDFELALESLESAEMDEVKIGKLRKEIETDISKLKPAKSSEPEPEVYPKPSRAPEVIGGRSDHVTQASRFVEMKYTEEKGRHLVAASTLSAGDAIIRESPYAAVLLPDYYHSHCHHCFTRTTGPIPCSHCPITLYCTEACRDAAWEKYHSVECPYLPLMHVIGIAHLALRVVVVSGIQFLKDFRSRGNDVYDWKSKYEFGYQSVFNLLHHTDDMNTDDLVQYCICAVLLLKCLKDSTFFHPANSPNDLNVNNGTAPDPETELYVGGLLLRHIQQLVCNAHAVSDWNSSAGTETMVCDVSDARIATAIYPTASLMNHSCDPNILSNFYNETLVVRVTKTINKGEEIFNSYGPHCKRMERYDRLQALEKQYFFTCTCTACSDISTTVERHKALKCPKCDGPLPRPQLGDTELAIVCAECGGTFNKVDLDEVLQKVYRSQRLMVEGMQAADRGEQEEAKENFRQCLKLQKQVLYKEHEDMAATCDQLARIYSLEENYKKAEPLVEFSAKVVGRIHGHHSVEYGTELKKLAQIQFNALMTEKSRKNVEKAKIILAKNLGEEDEQVKELEKMLKCLFGAKGQF